MVVAVQCKNSVGIGRSGNDIILIGDVVNFEIGQCVGCAVTGIEGRTGSDIQIDTCTGQIIKTYSIGSCAAIQIIVTAAAA